MKKIIKCSFMILLVLLLTASSVCAIEISKEDFVLTIKCDDASVDLAGIEISVYTSNLAYSEPDIGYMQFDEQFALSTTTNAEGIAVFARPSEYFSFSINKESLPTNFKLTEQTVFVYPSQKNCCVNIFYNNDTSEISNLEGANVPISELEIDSGVEISKEYKDILSMCKKLLGENKSISLNEEKDGTALYWTIRNFYEKNINSKVMDIKTIERAIDSFSPKSIEPSWGTYSASNSGHFRVYYDRESISVNVAKAVANVFDEVDAMFCTSWGLLRPYYDSNTAHYKIYLVDTTEYAGVTPLVGTDGSYININYTTANYIYNSPSSEYPDARRGVISHEYMHAIFYRYGILYNTVKKQWMHESFASWAGMAFESDYAAYDVQRIKNFLTSSEKSLYYFESDGIYKSRHYGSCLFPLYIQQELGGYATIKKILESYSSTSNVYTAIDLGLSYYDYSLAEAYSGCAVFNYDADYFYEIAPTIVSKMWGKGNITNCTTYPYSSSSINLPALSCNYTNFISPSNICTLTLTVECTGTNSKLKTIRKTNTEDYYITDRTITGNRCTIIQQNFGYNIAKEIAIIPINCGTSGTNSYTITAALN